MDIAAMDSLEATSQAALQMRSMGSGDPFALSKAERLVLDELQRISVLSAENKARIENLLEVNGASLTRIALDLGIVPEKALLDAASKVLGVPIVGEVELAATSTIDALGVSERFLRAQQILPLGLSDEVVVVAMADPFNRYAVDAFRFATERRLEVKFALASEIGRHMDRLFPPPDAGESANSASPELVAIDVERLRESASEAPTIRLLNDLISRAVQSGASDIHLETQERVLRVRFRIDGVLREDQTIPLELSAGVLSRLKILSGLDIAERRLPQDGAVKLALAGKQIDLRVGTVPLAEGEAASIRILDRSNVALDLAALGFDEGFRAEWSKLLRRPNGIVLVTGPTGSGKTTTLYASLQDLNTVERKIVSIEDPVEYRIAGINQIQIKPEIGLNFAAAFRSVLRHDPDIVFVGEIRDAETAKIAVQAALAGRLVLSTLHTNSAAGAVTRLLDMGAEDYLLASTLVGVLAQRLVRKRCHSCLGQTSRQSSDHCKVCNGSGFSGRTAVHELLRVSDDIEALIARRAATRAIHAAAVSGGMSSLWSSGLELVKSGSTTLAELNRVVHEED
jgi:general secretion pathway protein E